MKSLLLRLFWLEDSQIRMKGRRYAWVDIALGVSCFPIAAVYFATVKIFSAEICDQAGQCAMALSKDSALQKYNEMAAPAIKLLEHIPNLLDLLGWPIAVFIVLLGSCMLKTGFLYLKTHIAMNNAPGQQA